MMSIYQVDDGAVYHIDAKDHIDARQKWVAISVDVHGYKDEAAVVSDFGEPAIVLVQKTKAADISVRDDEHRGPCPTCGTANAVVVDCNLLEVWQENQALPEKKRAEHGVLCCSEW